MAPTEHGPPRRLRLALVALGSALLACATAADKRAPTLEQLELEHSIDRATQAFEKQELTIEAISADFRYRCLRATGADRLCECLVEKRPYGLRFEHYVRITSRTRSELDYEHLGADSRHLVDEVHAVRDACVELAR